MWWIDEGVRQDGAALQDAQETQERRTQGAHILTGEPTSGVKVALLAEVKI